MTYPPPVSSPTAPHVPRERRILVVEDELDWTQLMKRMLQERMKGRGNVHLVFETNAQDARYQMRCHAWDLVSVDLRLPAAHNDSAVDVVHGDTLVQQTLGAYPALAPLSKLLVYSGNFGSENVLSARSLPEGCDRHAKSGGWSDPELTRQGIESLTLGQWAQRILALMDAKGKYLPGSEPPRWSVVGNWLRNAPHSLPPLLAGAAQRLDQHWPDDAPAQPTHAAVDAALGFSETCLRLALVQTAVLLLHDGAWAAPSAIDWPHDDQPANALKHLQTWCATHTGLLDAWSWRQFLDDECLDAFNELRRMRAAQRHTLHHGKPEEVWDGLLHSLRSLMRLCGYWVQHPLMHQLQPQRLPDGRRAWHGEALAGSTQPRPRVERSDDAYPDNARPEQVWQTAVRLGPQPHYETTALCWQPLLQPTAAPAWWLPSHRAGRHLMAIDLASGLVGPLPTPP